MGVRQQLRMILPRFEGDLVHGLRILRIGLRSAQWRAMARAAADAPTGARLVWEDFPPETRRVFLAVAMAAPQADRIEGVL